MRRATTSAALGVLMLALLVLVNGTPITLAQVGRSAPGPSATSGGGGITSGTTAISGGGTTQVCFNDAGVISCGDAGLVFNKTTDQLTVGALTVTGSTGIITFSGIGKLVTPSNLLFQNGAGTATMADVGAGISDLAMPAAGRIGFGSSSTPALSDTYFERVADNRLRYAGDNFGVSGTAPAVSSCGTTPSGVTGNDTHGLFTTGSGGTVQSCTLTFATAFTAAPSCFCNSQTSIVVIRATTTTTTLVCDTAVAGTLASQVVNYACLGV